KAYDALTGASLWANQLPGQYSFSSTPTAVNGVVYVGGAGSGGTVYAVDESNGNLLWTASVMNGDDSSPAVVGQSVYVDYACNQAYSFDTLSGAPRWHHGGSCEGGGGATVAAYSNRLYLRDWAIGPLVLDASTGSEVGDHVSVVLPT